jgi:hypothetical protein
MNRIIAEIEAEIRRLQAARALLAGETNALKVGKPETGKKSVATRAKMVEAQKAGWARAKGSKSATDNGQADHHRPG